MKKTLMVFIFLVVVICCSSTTASAQLPGACWHYGTGLGSPLYPGAFDCVPSGWFSYTCKFWNTNCPPTDTKTELRGKCPSCSQPISLSSGNVDVEATDVRIPGLAGGLTLSRTWNSLWPQTQLAFQIGLFGPNWRSTYEERIYMGSDNFVRYARADGSFWSFVGSGTLIPIAPSNVAATLTADSAFTQWTLSFPNGEQRIFSYASGSLTAIIDRNGNTTQISYDSINRPVTITDPGGRHLYFGYASNSSPLITSVTSDVGISLTYTYDSQNRLAQVTEPDLTTVTYQYDANSNITAVVDSNGKILESHTYDDCGRGLTGARAGGVEAVSLSYLSPVCQTPPRVMYYMEAP